MYVFIIGLGRRGVCSKSVSEVRAGQASQASNSITGNLRVKSTELNLEI